MTFQLKKMTTIQLAKKIPHEFRERILLEWLPLAVARFDNEAFRILFEAYYIYIDPEGIPKRDCQICLNNVLTIWNGMKEAMISAEKEYNTLESID